MMISTSSTPKSALELLNAAIAELEARLNVTCKDDVAASATTATTTDIVEKGNPTKKSENQKGEKKKKEESPSAAVNEDIPDICKLEFKVGVITKVWVHESADKLYCEEIDIGEEQPRQIASGLRHHFSLEEMLGQRLIVISNLKPKNLVGFKSHGMVLCAAKTVDETKEVVEFVEPPIDATIGETITFDGLPLPNPVAPNVVEKKKIFPTAAAGMMANDEGIAHWNGHTFMTTAGPCRTRTITNSPLR
jgi:aminoacyl tRNA synthase complex-interacting multifunctional protein 1